MAETFVPADPTFSLDPHVVRLPSPIHGTGVFARHRIPAKSVFGIGVTHASNIFSFHRDNFGPCPVHLGCQLYCDGDHGQFINNSSDSPNLDFLVRDDATVWVSVNKDINKDEELVHRYGRGYRKSGFKH